MTTVQIALLQWDVSNKRMIKILERFNDEKYFLPIVANGNSLAIMAFWTFGRYRRFC